MKSSRIRVCVVGPGTRFLSGITYHTYGLCQALSGQQQVSTILLRRLLPQKLYPGSARVGANLSRLDLPRQVPRYDGIDWFWIPTIIRAAWFFFRQRPHVIVLQWWTGAVLHTYLLLAALARAIGCSVVIEMHETQDPGEELVPLAQRYVRAVAPLLFRLATGFVVHSEFDRDTAVERYGIDRRCVRVIAGTLEPYGTAEPLRDAPPAALNLLYFGVIRPYKGVEDLIEAFNSIPGSEIHRYWLTLVGETWQDCLDLPELVARSPHRERITVVNRYVTDSEVEGYFAGADVVVLPYRRPCFSGPLLVAVNYGLPVVATRVGGVVETLHDYKGTILVEPHSPKALEAALRRDAPKLAGRRFRNGRNWQTVAAMWEDFLRALPSWRGDHNSRELAEAPESAVGTRFDRTSRRRRESPSLSSRVSSEYSEVEAL